MNQQKSAPTSRQAGLTIVELIVAILLAAVMTSGLFYMLSGQQKTYTEQYNQMGRNANLWGAMNFLERQIQTRRLWLRRMPRWPGHGTGPL